MSNQFPLISVNGVFNGTVSPLDRGFAYGDGIFETCRYQAGAIPLWEFHRHRLTGACQTLMIPLDYSLLEAHLTSVVQRVQNLGGRDGVIKILVTRGPGGRGYALPEQVSPTICIIFFDAVPDSPQNIRIRLCRQRLSRNSGLAGLKHLNRLEQVMARAEWVNEYHEGLMLDDEGSVVEVTAGNVFLVRDKQLITPDLSDAGVAGIMRRIIVERLAPGLKLPVTIKKVSLAELQAADEVFVCNSIRGIMSVSALDGDFPAQYHRHEVTHSLQDQLTILLRDEAAEASC